MKPSDCRDYQDTLKLKESGLQINNESIEIRPNVIIIRLGNTCTIRINQTRFKQFAKWYFEDQK